jgi:hypothetical protein
MQKSLYCIILPSVLQHPLELKAAAWQAATPQEHAVGAATVLVVHLLMVGRTSYGCAQRMRAGPAAAVQYSTVQYSRVSTVGYYCMLHDGRSGPVHVHDCFIFRSHRVAIAIAPFSRQLS